MDKHNCSCTNHNHAHEEQNISGIPHCCHNHETSCEVQNPLIKIIMSFVFLTAAITVRHIDFDFLKNIIENPNNLQKKLEVFFSLVSWLLCGRIVAINAVKNILKGKFFDEQFLMTIASLGAVLIGELPEAAAVMLFYQVGEFFQDKALDKSRDSINSLMKLRPDSAHLIENGTEKDVLPEDIKIGDIVIVRPGERIPVDGKIVSGRGFIDNSELTGESVPVECTEGYEVFSGTINKDGVLKIECTNIAGKSAAARILALVEEAQNKKAKTEKFISRFSKIYTPIVCIAALVVAVIPSLITKDYHTWIYKALMFLVVSCPCALVISVPLSFFSGIGLAGKKGILLKGSTCIENLANVKIAVFDKTGTLTKGSFTVTDVHCIKEIAPEELIKIAAHAEIHSNHPVSKSLRLAHNDECCRNVEILQQKEYSGMGIQTELEGKTILAGNERLMLKNKVSGYSPCEKKDIGTIIHIAIDGKYAGHIVISDVLKEDSLNAVKKLKKLGVNKIVMLTGDNEEAAQQAGKGAGIKEIYSTLLPEGKLTKIEELLESLKNKKGIQKGNLLFAGDGINDAPVLTRSDIGIAMGGLGADAAIEAADAVIMTDELSKIPMAIEISRKTLNIVYQNITISLAVKFAIMILGIFGIANMWFAVFGDVGVTFAAVLNASRLLLMGKNQK